MQVGMATIFQNPENRISDGEVYRNECVWRISPSRSASTRSGGYWETARKHYEFGGEHFAKTKGYEFYAAMSEAQRASANQMTEMYLDLQVWGTPKMCIDRIRQTCEKTQSNAFTSVFSYAGMSYDEAERNLRLFAAKVLPVLRNDVASAAAG